MSLHAHWSSFVSKVVLNMFNEKSLLEDYVVQALQKKGWKFIAASELEREGLDEPLLLPVLCRAIRRINGELGITDEEISKAVSEIRAIPPTSPDGCKKLLYFFKFGIPIKFEKEHELKNVRLFDLNNYEKNEFVVSRQVYFHSANQYIRTDIMLFVNGIPLVEIESKNPADPSVSWVDAYRQITADYQKKVPDLYKYVLIGIAANAKAVYFPIIPWRTAEYAGWGKENEATTVYEWKAEGIPDPIDATLQMLDRATLLNIVRNYLFSRESSGSKTRVIARYMQYGAAEKIVRRVTANLLGKDQKNRGLISHWQGAGKTLTMMFAANKLFNDHLLNNPSIFIVVDRRDLEEQSQREYAGLDIPNVERIETIDALKKVIAHDDWSGKRGMFLCLVQKFRPDDLAEITKILEKLSKVKQTITNRKNVIVFIDEAHRSHYGDLSAQMRQIFSGEGGPASGGNGAFFFAFTGTPIDERIRNTYDKFSYKDDVPCLDMYTMRQSIEDCTTLRIAYQPRMPEAHLKKDLLDQFLEADEDELEELDEETRERVKGKVKALLDNVTVYLENPNRIEKTALDIASHFRASIEGKFKAMIVCASRKACVEYKKAMDKLLPPEYSEVVMNHQDLKHDSVRNYSYQLTKRFRMKDFGEINRKIIQNYKEEENPRILIVTELLITGFDCPILQTMYLDKPLKGHRLLQAIARTNRPFRDLKECGLIIDYAGVLKELKKALRMYASLEIKGAIFDIETIKAEFIALLKETTSLFTSIPKNRSDGETLSDALALLLRNHTAGKEFDERYKKLRRLYQILASDVSKLKYFNDYKWLSAVHAAFQKRFRAQSPEEEMYVEKYYDRTLKDVHKSTDFEKAEEDLPPLDIDENFLAEIERRYKKKEDQLRGIAFALTRFVLVEKNTGAVYESIIERVEKILKKWREAKAEVESLLFEAREIVARIPEISRRQRELGASDLEYSIMMRLEEAFNRSDGVTPPLQDETLLRAARDIVAILESKQLRFTNWQSQSVVRKKVEMEVRKFLRRFTKELGRIDELTPKIMDCLIRYG